MGVEFDNEVIKSVDELERKREIEIVSERERLIDCKGVVRCV